MTTRNVKILAVLAITLATAQIAFTNHARADDSEGMNAPRQNWPQNDSFRNQGGWNQGNRNNCGNGNNCGQNNARQGNDEQEHKQSRFSRKNRDGRGGGGDGGDDD